MTRPRDIVRRIGREAKRQNLDFGLDREGSNHTVYKLDGTMIAIPRHNDIGEGLTEAIYKQCQDKLGKGWWRR